MHPAPADFTVVALPAVDHAPSTEETEPFKTDESAATPPPDLAYRVTARISIQDEPPTPLWSDIKVARLLAIPTPPPSPLSPWSSPLPQIPSPPLPVSSPVPVISPSPPASPIRSLDYQASMIRLRTEAPSTSHLLPLPPPIRLFHTRSDAPSSGIPPLLPIPLPTSSPPLHLLSTDRRADRPEVTLMPQKRLGITLGLRYEGDYAGSKERCRQDIDEIYMRLDDEQSDRQLMAGRLNILYRDRSAHARTVRLVVAQQVVITELQAANHRRQATITNMLAADRRRQTQFIEALKLLKRLQTQMTEFERQRGPAKGLAQPDAPEEAGSSS
ncbi:hypothetical protein Tco_1461986 [Tanacetum coccineum]